MDRQEGQLALAADFAPGQTIRFRYRNWQGSVAVREAQIVRLIFGATEWHREPQWLLEAHDLEKNATRLFALRDMVPID